MGISLYTAQPIGSEHMNCSSYKGQKGQVQSQAQQGTVYR